MEIKLCECGCGNHAPIAKMTCKSKGHVAGQPMRFINGHGGHRFTAGNIHNATHGMYGTPEQTAYRDAKLRCTLITHPKWPRYGGRGIKFLLEPFEIFFMELGPRPEGKDKRGKALYSLDRINNDGNYEPGNVQWATKQQQAENKTHSNQFLAQQCR